MTPEHEVDQTSGASGPGGLSARRPLRRARRLLWVAGPGALLVAVLALVDLTGTDAWTDEAASLAATVQFREVVSRTGGTMAAYYAVLNGWIQVSDSLWWVRFLSVLGATAAVLATGAAAVLRRGGPRRGVEVVASHDFRLGVRLVLLERP